MNLGLHDKTVISNHRGPELRLLNETKRTQMTFCFWSKLHLHTQDLSIFGDKRIIPSCFMELLTLNKETFYRLSLNDYLLVLVVVHVG